MLGLKGFYTQAAAAWDPLVEVWSIDAYPNMIIASPMRPGKIAERILNVSAVTDHMKDVFVMETGYPRLDVNVTPLPPTTPSNWSVLDFSPANQARYSELAIENVLSARGAGIFFFHFEKSNFSYYTFIKCFFCRPYSLLKMKNMIKKHPVPQ